MLIRHLPADSEFFRKALPDDAKVAGWSATDYILADLFDLTAAIGLRGSRKKPEPYPRIRAQVDKANTDDRRRAALIARYKQRNPDYREPEGAE